MFMVQVMFPLLDSLTNLLLTIIEAIKGYFNVKIATYNQKTKKLVMDENEKVINQIGFQLPEEEEEEYE